MDNLIKKLQDKSYVRAFGLMSPEEQQILATAKYKNRFVFISGWVDDFDGVGGRDEFTFALKPDYQPEPEYVDLEIKQEGHRLAVHSVHPFPVHYYHFMPHNFTPLHCLPSLPNFEGFWVNSPSTPCSFEYISRTIRNGKKTVYARFRKEQP
jgi:hypothetical protein